MKKEISARRIIVYDFIRGVLMFGVTLGHVISALIHTSDLIPWFCVFVRSYDMPLFAMISGIFLRISLDKKEWWRVMLNKITTILYPAFLWELIFGIIKRDIRFGTSCWFLYALFFSSVIICLLVGLVKNTRLRLATMILVSIMAHCMPDTCHTALLLIPTIFGFYLDDMRRLTKNVKKDWKYAILFVTWIILLCFWQGKFSVWYVDGYVLDDMPYSILIVGFRAIIGIVGSIAVMMLLQFIHQHLSIWKPLVERLELVGKMSLEQYILQCFFVTYLGAVCVRLLVKIIGYNPFVINIGFTVFVVGPIVVIVILIMQHYITEYLKKIPFIGQYIFGFKIL